VNPSSIYWRKKVTEQSAGDYRQTVPANKYEDDEYQGPGLMDGVRFLYRRRLGLAVRFIVLFGIAVIGLAYYHLTAPKIVSGTVGLTFRGIERNEYPSGKRFSVEDFRSPDLLTKALGDAAIPEATLGVTELAARLFVDPVIPRDIQTRWKKQEKDGANKDQYYPNEFNISLQISGLTNPQRLRLFDALVARYQERVKYEQVAALSFVNNADVSYEKLAATYDFWDIPALFRATFRSLNLQVAALITESLQYQDPKYQLAFRNINKELITWLTTRLQALEALTYQGRLVKNRDLMIQRVQYQIEDIDLQIKQKIAEAGEAERLLGIIERPRALLAGQLSTKEGMSVVDANALDKLIKSDYVGPVVDRVSKLQQEIQVLETEKARLQKQLGWLPKASNVDLKQLPPMYGELVQTLTSELGGIIQEYNRLLDDYLTATITSLVTVKQSPIITREEYSPLLILAGLVFMCCCLAIFMLSVEHLFQKVKLQATTPKKNSTRN
jgi:hypothetical protein